MKRILINLALLYVFIGITAIAALNTIFVMVLHLLATALVVAWLLAQIRHRKAWLFTPLDWVLAGYVVWLGITTLFSQNSRVSLEFSWLLVIQCIIFYMIVDTMRHGHQRWIWEGLFLAAGVAVVIGVAEFLSWYFGVGLSLSGQGWFAIGGWRDPFPPQFYDLKLLMGSPNQLGVFTLLAFPVVVAWGRTAGQRDYRVGLGLLAFGLAWLLVMSGSRGAWGASVAMIGVIVAFQLIRWRILPPRLALGLMVLGVVLIAATLVAYAFQSNSTSDQRRIDLWQSALKMVEKDPLTGVGVYRFGIEYRQYRNTDFIQDRTANAHDMYLNTLAEIGILGVLLLVALGGAFLRLWWQVWQGASAYQQIRLEGILAGLIGFSVHSTLEAFSWPVSLVLVIYGAYVVALGTPPIAPPRLAFVYRTVPYVALVGVVVYGGWLFQIDRAGIAVLRSTVAINKDDYEAALTQLERAEDLDPTLGLYPLQRAYIVGLMAADHPDRYLQQAIVAHEQTLADDPTYDTALANLAALYSQRGDYIQAVERLQTAVEIDPERWQLLVALGQAYEQAGDTEQAVATYQEALWRYPAMSQSAFWQQTTLRQDSLRAAYANADTPAMQLLLAVYQGWLPEAEAAAPYVERDSWVNYLVLGRYAMLLGDYPKAVEDFGYAIDLDDRELEVGEIYAERAKAYFALGDDEAAQCDAQTAIFLSPVEGATGYWVLAQLELKQSTPDQSRVDEYLAQAVMPYVVFREYTQVAYGRQGWINYLPQLALPGEGADAYAPWFLLAERYANDDDPDTDPADVYEAILERDPYVTVPQ